MLILFLSVGKAHHIVELLCGTFPDAEVDMRICFFCNRNTAMPQPSRNFLNANAIFVSSPSGCCFGGVNVV